MHNAVLTTDNFYGNMIVLHPYKTYIH